MVRKMTKEEVMKYIKSIVKSNLDNSKNNSKYKKINESKSLKSFIYAYPILLYCKNESCNASKDCMKELLKKGIVNIKLYEGGIDDYHKRKKMN